MGCKQLRYYEKAASPLQVVHSAIPSNKDKALKKKLFFTERKPLAKNGFLYFLYEDEDHLGSVRVVVSDMKLWSDDNTNSTPDGGEFTADVVSYANYYAFGSQQSKRCYLDASTRGFGGQEKDDEIYGVGNAYTAEYWEYDSRLGRRWNVDPIVYAFQSPYAAFNNNSIYFNDPTGLEGKGGGGGGAERRANRYAKKHGGTVSSSTTKGKFWVDGLPNEDGSIGTRSKAFNSNFFDKVKGSLNSAKNWANKKWNNVKNWFKESKFVLKVKGKLDVGVQGKLKGTWYGVANASVDINVVKYELLSGEVDFAALYRDDPDAYSGSYIGKDGVKVEQGVDITAGVAGYDLIGGKYEHSFTAQGGSYGDEKSEGGLYLIVPLMKKKTSKQVANDAYKQAAEATGLSKTPKIKDAKVGKQGDFYGIDLGVGAAVILGADLGLKIGFEK